jgi:serine/threonine-protein kinase
MRASMAGDGEFRRLGPYVLLRASGAGGMGRIDLALRALPGGGATLCVLKRMHAELRGSEQDARFRREANIALQLSHPAIAQTVGVEEIDGELVLLQELVHGVDLRLLETRLATAGERVPLAIAAHIVSEVARALAHAHAFGDLGIVHRDVTPDNVMLGFSGDVKLVDFGIARSNVDATVTSTGHIVGRPIYTPPEVWEGTRADRRADIYSLGVVLWQLLTARRLKEARLGGGRPAPAPSTINPELPAELDAVVSRALARDPNERYQGAGELQEALRPFLPADPGAQPALAELLARHFDVARERRMLAVDVQRAMRLLGSAPEPEPDARPPVSVTEAMRTDAPARDRRPMFVVAGIAVAGVALAITTVVGLRGPTRSTLPPVVRVAPPAPPPRIVAAERPPAPAAVHTAPAAIPRTPAPAHPVPTSAGRARPASTKTARPMPSTPPEELLRRAQDKFDVGETQSALALARQAMGAGARGPAHILMGKVFMSERRYDDAEREFAEAVRLDPNDARAARLLALVRDTRRGGP